MKIAATVTVFTMEQLKNAVNMHNVNIVISNELMMNLCENPFTVKALSPMILLNAYKIAERHKSDIALSRMPKNTMKYYNSQVVNDDSGNNFLMLTLKSINSDDKDGYRMKKLDKNIYYFSEHFLEGIQTKSAKFQNKFYEIIDGVCEYFDTEEERREFHSFIEAYHSYDKPGNVLYSTKTFFGKHSSDALKEKIQFMLLSLFDRDESAEAMAEVPHIIICVSAPDDYFSNEDIEFLEKIISFERYCRDYPPVRVTTIFNDTDNDRGISCYIAALK